MNSADLSKILEEHKVWITSMRESGSRADLCGTNLRGADLCGTNCHERCNSDPHPTPEIRSRG